MLSTTGLLVEAKLWQFCIEIENVERLWKLNLKILELTGLFQPKNLSYFNFGEHWIQSTHQILSI